MSPQAGKESSCFSRAIERGPPASSMLRPAVVPPSSLHRSWRDWKPLEIGRATPFNHGAVEPKLGERVLVDPVLVLRMRR